MNFLASLDDTLGTLVHPDARSDPVDFSSHKIFLATRLGLSLGALALAPLCFVSGDTPAAWEAGVLAWLSLPFAAAVSVSRSGDLRIGEAVSLAAWIGLAVTVTLGTGSSLGMGLLLMVPLEAVTALAAAPTLGGLAVAAVAVLVLHFRGRFGFSPGGVSTVGPLGSAALATVLAYAGLLSILANRIARLRRGQEKASQNHYRALIEAIDDVVLRFDRSGVVCQASAASGRLFGVDARDLLGRGFFERLHVADRPVFLKLVTDVAVIGQPRTATLRFRTGKTVPSARGAFDEPVFAWVDLGGRPPAGRDSGSEPCGAAQTRCGVAMLGLLRDVSARVEQEQVLAQVNRVSDRTNAGRDLFLASVSHELRTPLNAIIGFAEMLSNEGLIPARAEKQREYAAIIHQSGLHLLAVVNSILDASKIESGSFDIVPESFEIGALVHLCCDMVGLKAEQSRVLLVREAAGGADDLVGDKRACKQIILNLLSNALKFTPVGGQVTIGVRPDGNSVLITVADTGIGIAPSDLPRLGDPFFQARASYDRPNDGTGLGLSVVRGLVGLHGGTIAIESAPGHGTRVTVRLPSDCRRGSTPTGAVTKIETISHYSSPVRHGDMPGGGRMHKIA